jgi:hypothetical protein
VTNLPPLNRISSRDSKKEEARRREINKGVAPKVGRRPSSFVDECEIVIPHLALFIGVFIRVSLMG